MSEQPPPCTEVDAEVTSLPELSSALVVHLQVWHHRSEGRSPANNDRFAALFRNLQAWEVIPLEVDGITGPSSHDQYVPVEVRFRHRVWAYNDPGEHPMADVRELFYKVAPQFIYQFFIQISSAPHNLNIFPVGVPDEFLSRYTHVYNLNPLSIRVDAFFVPAPARTNDVQSWLRDAASSTADVLGILAAIVFVYLEYQENQTRGNENSRPSFQGSGQNARFLDVNVPERFPALQALFHQFRQLFGTPSASQPPAQVANVQAVLNVARSPLLQYLRLANRMESRLSRLENNQTLSNQDLYELVHDTNNAAIYFSALKKARKPLVRLLEEDYNMTIQDCQKAQAKSAIISGGICGLIAVAAGIVFLSNPFGLAAAGLVGGIIGGCAGAGTHYMVDAERGKAYGKLERVDEFNLAIKQLDECATQARETIAMVFIAQVMRKRMDETSPEHDRRSVLESFGVDANALPDPIYREEIIRDRLRKFRTTNNDIRMKLERVLADAKFEIETTEQAA